MGIFFSCFENKNTRRRSKSSSSKGTAKPVRRKGERSSKIPNIQKKGRKSASTKKNTSVRKRNISRQRSELKSFMKNLTLSQMINNSVEYPIDSEVLNGPKNPTFKPKSSSRSTSSYKKNNTSNHNNNSSSFIDSLFNFFSTPASQSNTTPSRSSNTPTNSYFYSPPPPPPPTAPPRYYEAPPPPPPTQPAQTTIPSYYNYNTSTPQSTTSFTSSPTSYSYVYTNPTQRKSNTGSVNNRTRSVNNTPSTSTSTHNSPPRRRRSNSDSVNRILRRVNNTFSSTAPTATIPPENNEEIRDNLLTEQEQAIIQNQDEIDKLRRKLREEMFKNIIFSSRFKHTYMEITGSGKRATCIETSMSNPHCYINIKLEEGKVYHLTFQMSYIQRPFFVIGCTSNDKYLGDSLNSDKTSCSVSIWDEHSILLGGNGNKIILQSFNSIKAQNNSKFDVIFDMNYKTFSIQQDNIARVYLFRNLTPPLYPFVCLINKGNSFEIVDYWEE